jgi:diguanylate cyclase (GGDEF)-like protein
MCTPTQHDLHLPMNAFARLATHWNTILGLPPMSAEQQTAFRASQARFRQPLVVPTVLLAVLLTTAFVGWDQARDPGHLGAAATVRLLGAVLVLGLLGVLRTLPDVSLRIQAHVMYCAVYAWQAAIGHALGPLAPMQLPGLLIIMFGGILALPRADDARINVPLALLSVPLVLPQPARAADLIYVAGHFATVVALVYVACALLERLFAQNFIFHDRLQREASTDALTGLQNRREFETCITREMGRAQRLGVPLSLAVIDVDHFKRINDRFGHDAGDQVLRELAARLKADIRNTDLLARLGGEEFGLVMLGSTQAEGCVLLERLRGSIERMRLDIAGEALACTISIGITDRVETDEDWTMLYRRADQALYSAKESGRNRIAKARAAGPTVPA